MSELEEIKKVLARERLARKEAERILESKSLEIFNKSQEIEALKSSLIEKSRTELKKIAQRQDLLLKLFDTHPFPILIVSEKKHEIIQANDQAEMLFAVSKRRNLIFEDLCVSNEKEVKVGSFRQKKPFLQVSKMIKHTGDVFDVKLKSISTEFMGKKVYLVIVSDLTEKVILQKQNNESQRKYKDLVEKSSDIIYSIDIDGRINYMNPIGLKLFGYTLEEIKDIDFKELINKEYKERVVHFYNYQISSKTDLTYSEFPVITKNGEEHWLGQNVNISFDDGKVNVSVVARVVTEKKRLEREIIKSEEKYRSLINNLELGLVEVDNSGIIQKAHPSFCKMVGYSKEEIEGTNGEFMLDENAKSIMNNQKVIRQKGVLGLYEIQLITKSGERIWVMISGAPTYDHQNKINGSIGIHLNITEQKLLESELRLAAKIAKDSLKSKELFLANISHEMRTPLNGIIGLSELIYEENQSNESLNSKTESILLSSKNLLNLIDDLLLFTKIENNQIELAPEFDNLFSSTNILMQTHETAALKKEIDFVLRNSLPKNYEYYIDSYRLHQVLNNLISNAIKFTSHGSVEVECNVVHTTQSFDIIEFKINDTGIGIPNDEIDKIFGTFQQASNNDSKKYGGTGLGLSIVKELVNLMGAHLDLETSDKGTLFTLEFTLEKRLVSVMHENEKMTLQSNFSNLRVLVAEDNRINQQVVGNMLHKFGANIRFALNGLEAIEAFKTEDFDIILMDLRMPVMDGIESTREIRKIDTRIPIIAATANTTLENKNDYLSMGFTDMLSKPFTSNDLKIILEKYTKKDELDLIDRLLRITENDIDIALELAIIFSEDSTSRLKDILKENDNQNVKKISSIAHSMKPSLLQLAESDIVANAIKLEMAIEWTKDFEILVNDFLQKLRVMLDKMNEEVIPKLEKMSQGGT